MTRQQRLKVGLFFAGISFPCAMISAFLATHWWMRVFWGLLGIANLALGQSAAQHLLPPPPPRQVAAVRIFVREDGGDEQLCGFCPVAMADEVTDHYAAHRVMTEGRVILFTFRMEPCVEYVS